MQLLVPAESTLLRLVLYPQLGLYAAAVAAPLLVDVVVRPQPRPKITASGALHPLRELIERLQFATAEQAIQDVEGDYVRRAIPFDALGALEAAAALALRCRCTTLLLFSRKEALQFLLAQLPQ